LTFLPSSLTTQIINHGVMTLIRRSFQAAWWIRLGVYLADDGRLYDYTRFYISGFDVHVGEVS